ncbi:MAG: magnesium transporter, partial [Campylobacterota bacterium]|nr:magnesium transporter [Campylobacterota bacterium]
LLELPSETFICALGRIPPHKIAAAAEKIESDEATDLIQLIKNANEDLSHKVLSLIEQEDRSEIVELSKYNDDQAGAYMEREFLSAQMGDTVADVKESVRRFRREEPATPIIKLFVIDSKNKLLGSVHFTDLILFDDIATIEEVVSSLGYRPPLSIRPVSPVNEVVRLFEEYDLNIVAVVDKSGNLIGRIVYDDIYDMIRHIEMDQAYALAGVREESEEGSLKGAAKQRLVWLLVNLFTVLAASLVISQFDEIIITYVALAALLPLVAALGGNAGMQALTVTIRKLALGEIEYSNTIKTLKREALIVLFNGMAVAAVSSVVVYVWFGDPRLSVIMAMALLFTILISGVAGTLIPLGLNKAGIDPAVASSVFLTTTTDILGFFIFLAMADAFL